MHSTEQTKMIKNLCKVCGVTVSYTNFARHMQSHNEEAKLKCDICEQSFKTSNSLYQHVKVHRNPEEDMCNLCDKVLLSRSALRNHHKTQHELIEFLCPYCHPYTNKGGSKAIFSLPEGIFICTNHVIIVMSLRKPDIGKCLKPMKTKFMQANKMKSSCSNIT